jgi:hypothetical protein
MTRLRPTGFGGQARWLERRGALTLIAMAVIVAIAIAGSLIGWWR